MGIPATLAARVPLSPLSLSLTGLHLRWYWGCFQEPFIVWDLIVFVTMWQLVCLLGPRDSGHCLFRWVLPFPILNVPRGDSELSGPRLPITGCWDLILLPPNWDRQVWVRALSPPVCGSVRKGLPELAVWAGFHLGIYQTLVWIRGYQFMVPSPEPVVIWFSRGEAGTSVTLKTKERSRDVCPGKDWSRGQWLEWLIFVGHWKST